MGDKVKYWIACSGGVDSVVLAHLMHRMGKPIGLLHCNFQLRGTDSEEDEYFVEELAKTLDIPVKVKRFNVINRIKILGGNVQLAARELRYDWFNAVLANYDGYICLGHHKDDQVETFLLQLGRGGKVKGLASMPLKKDKFLRPLLEKSKEEIIELAKDNNWSWREDHSNRENNYKRNLYRNQLIPLLKEKIDVNEIVLSVVKSYQELLNYCSETSFAKKNIYGVHEIDTQQWNELPEILKKFELERFGLNKIPSGEVDRLCKSSSGAKIDLEKVTIYKHREKLMFVNEQLLKWSFSISTVKKVDVKILSKKLQFADRSRISGKLRSRKWLSSDRIVPLGMTGSKKIGKYLKDQGVPGFFRAKIPIVVDGLDNVVFVPGFTVDDRFKVQHFTKELIKCAID